MIWWLWVALAGATPSTGSVRTSAVDEVIAVALERSPWIAEARARAASAEGRVQGARAAENPQLRFQADDLEATGALTPRWEIDLRMPVPELDSGADVAAARSEAEGATARLDRAVAAVTEDVRRSFYGVVIAHQLIRVDNDRIDAARQRLAYDADDAEERLDGRLRLAKVVADQEAARRVQIEAHRRLALHTGDAVVASLTAPLERPTAPRLDAIQAVAEVPAEVREADAAVAVARAQLREATLDWVPWFDFVELGTDLEANDPVRLSAQVGVRVPVWAYGTGDRRAARAELARREAERDAARATASADVEVAWARVREAAGVWRAYAEVVEAIEADAPAEDLSRKDRARWDWRVAEVRRAELEALWDWYEARFRLARVVGRDVAGPEGTATSD